MLLSIALYIIVAVFPGVDSHPLTTAREGIKCNLRYSGRVWFSKIKIFFQTGFVVSRPL